MGRAGSGRIMASANLLDSPNHQGPPDHSGGEAEMQGGESGASQGTQQAAGGTRPPTPYLDPFPLPWGRAVALGPSSPLPSPPPYPPVFTRWGCHCWLPRGPGFLPSPKAMLKFRVILVLPT